MKQPTLRMKLALIGGFTSRDYKAIRAIRHLILDGEAKILDWKWMGWLSDYRTKYENNQEHQLKDDIWMTYDRLLLAKIEIKGKNIVATIRCSEGENMNGMYKGDRWEATVQLKAKHLSLFSAKINYEITEKAKRLFDEEEEKRVKNRIEEIRNELLQKAMK